MTAVYYEPLELRDMGGRLDISSPVPIFNQDSDRIEFYNATSSLKTSLPLDSNRINNISPPLAVHNPRPASVVSLTRRCGICIEEKDVDDFPTFLSANCTHQFHSCKECIGAWIAAQLETQGWNSIRCPECFEAVTEIAMRTYGSEQVYKRYQTLQKRAQLSLIPNYQFCLSPSCLSGQVQPPSSPKFTCTTCSQKYCLHHKVPWHTRETCNQYDDRVSGARQQREIENASERWKARETRTCTHCKAVVQKNGGCPAMFCTVCKKSFRWGSAGAYRAALLGGPGEKVMSAWFGKGFFSELRTRSR